MTPWSASAHSASLSLPLRKCCESSAGSASVRWLGKRKNKAKYELERHNATANCRKNFLDVTHQAHVSEKSKQFLITEEKHTVPPLLICIFHYQRYSFHINIFVSDAQSLDWCTKLPTHASPVCTQFDPDVLKCTSVSCNVGQCYNCMVHWLCQCLWLSVLPCLWVCVCLCMCVQVCMHACMHVCVCMSVCVCVCVHTAVIVQV